MNKDGIGQYRLTEVGDAAIALARAMQDDIDRFWYLNFYGQLATVVLGVLATTLVAAQGTNASAWLRCSAVACTVSLSIITGSISSFRLKDGYENLNDLQGEVLDRRNYYMSMVNDDQKNNDKFDLVVDFSKDISSFERRRRKIIGSFSSSNNNTPPIQGNK